MEPEREPSSQNRSSLWPLFLLGILAWGLSNVKTPMAPQPCECYRQKTPWWKTLLEVSALFVACWLLVANIRQSRATEKATNIAHDTLVMSERAWVGQSGPIWLDFFNGANNQPAVRIHLVLENFGHSPALSVFHAAELVPHEELIRAADLTCRFAKAEAGLPVPGMLSSGTGVPPTGQTIFPQQKWGSALDDGPIKSKTVVLYAVGCVIYRDDVTDGIWWTRFCQETPSLAASYKSGEPLATCTVYNETGKYEKNP